MMTAVQGEDVPDEPAQLNAWMARRVGQRSAPSWIDLSLLPAAEWNDGATAPAEPILALMASKNPSDAAIWKSLAPRWDRVSFSGFAWKVFDIWQSHPKPPKGSRWVADVLAHFGDESAMVRLAQLVREWTKRRSYPRIRTAIEIFAANETAMAVAQLDWLSGAGPTSALRRLAADKLGEVADARGISVEELADAAPALGLSRTGEWTREAKGQSFTLRLEPDLSISIQDSSGKTRKSMPKTTNDRCDFLPLPILRKQVQELASHHSARLERAMITERAWPADRWRELFLEHPLLRLLAQRIIWTSLDSRAQETTFRVAEDFTLADEVDELFVLPNDARIRVAHPLYWSETTRQHWRCVFEDYRLTAPFEQASRGVFTPTREEMSKTEVERFHGCRVDSRVLLSRLRQTGWRVGPAVMGPITFVLFRQFDERDLTAALHHEGMYLAGGTALEVRLGDVAFARMSDGPFGGHGIEPQDRLPIGSAPSLPFSEALRDIDRICRR